MMAGKADGRGVCAGGVEAGNDEVRRAGGAARTAEAAVAARREKEREVRRHGTRGGAREGVRRVMLLLRLVRLSSCNCC
jgi:hypothetical protein